MKHHLLLVVGLCSITLAGCGSNTNTAVTLEIDPYLLNYQGKASLKEQQGLINTEALAVYEEEGKES
jgi:hypothetical protein